MQRLFYTLLFLLPCNGLNRRTRVEEMQQFGEKGEVADVSLSGGHERFGVMYTRLSSAPDDNTSISSGTSPFFSQLIPHNRVYHIPFRRHGDKRLGGVCEGRR
jgi:hypothetical protein